jgi:hypothetical protein
VELHAAKPKATPRSKISYSSVCCGPSFITVTLSFVSSLLVQQQGVAGIINYERRKETVRASKPSATAASTPSLANTSNGSSSFGSPQSISRTTHTEESWNGNSVSTFDEVQRRIEKDKILHKKCDPINLLSTGLSMYLLSLREGYAWEKNPEDRIANIRKLNNYSTWKPGYMQDYFEATNRSGSTALIIIGRPAELDESKEILSHMDRNYKAVILQNLVTVLLATDADQDMILSDEEINELICNREGIHGVQLKEDLLRQTIIE